MAFNQLGTRLCRQSVLLGSPLSSQDPCIEKYSLLPSSRGAMHARRLASTFRILTTPVYLTHSALAARKWRQEWQHRAQDQRQCVNAALNLLFGLL